MNKVVLMGRLVRDPDCRYSQGENSMSIARFTLAVDRRVARKSDNGEQTADFIGCVAFGKQGEFVEKYLRKGTKVALTGRIQTGNYTKDGQKVYTTDIVAEEIEFAESKNSEGGYNNNYAEKPQGNAPDDGFINIPDGVDEELPFN